MAAVSYIVLWVIVSSGRKQPFEMYLLTWLTSLCMGSSVCFPWALSVVPTVSPFSGGWLRDASAQLTKPSATAGGAWNEFFNMDAQERWRSCEKLGAAMVVNLILSTQSCDQRVTRGWNKPSSWEDSCSLSPLLLPSVDNYCPVSAENVWYLIFPHHLNKHVAITERYLATGVERCICMKESVYTLARQTTAFSFAKLREVPMSQNRQNRYIDFGCIFGRKLLKIQNIKKIGKQNITTSVYNWCDFSLNEPSCRSPR